MDIRPVWTKRHHRDEQELLTDLGDLLLKAALDGIRDLFCIRGGNLPNDDKYISGNLGLSYQKWQAIKGKLIDAGHILVASDQIECPLALASYLESASYMEQRRQAGIKSGHARKVKRDAGVTRGGGKAPHSETADQTGPHINKYSDLDSTIVQPPLKQQTETKTIESGGGRVCTISDALRLPAAPGVAQALMKRMS